MAIAAVTATVSLPFSKSSLSTRSSISSDRITFHKMISKKDDEGVVVNKYKPKDPYIGRCLLNTKISGDDAPGKTWHMVFTTEGEVPYSEGQSIGVIPDGIDRMGNLTS